MIIVDSNLEFFSACITIRHKKGYLLYVCYRPPIPSSTLCPELHDVLNKLIVRFPGCPLFLLDDFNVPTVNWTSDTPSLAANPMECSSFLNICVDFNLGQLVFQPKFLKSFC